MLRNVGRKCKTSSKRDLVARVERRSMTPCATLAVKDLLARPRVFVEWIWIGRRLQRIDVHGQRVQGLVGHSGLDAARIGREEMILTDSCGLRGAHQCGIPHEIPDAAMQVGGCRIEVLAIFDADQIRHLHRIEEAAVPARYRAAAGTGGEQPGKFSRRHGLQPLVDIVLRPRDAERPVQPHAEGLVAHAERNRRGHDAIRLMDRHEQRSRAVLAARQRRSADDRAAILHVGDVATGTI